jgi:hypothetical protein
MIHSKGFGELFGAWSVSKRTSGTMITKEKQNVPDSDRIVKLQIRLDILSLPFRVWSLGEVERRKKSDHRNPNN